MKVHMQKLDGAQSWRRWKRQMELMLKHHGVLDIAQGLRTMPVMFDHADGANADEVAGTEQAHKERVKAYEKDDSLAQVLMVSAVDDAHVELTATCNSAREIWQKLLSIYEQSSSQRLDRTLEQFFSAKVSDNEELVQYISRLQLTFREVNEELQKHNANALPDIVLMSRIMSTLPSEFFEFKSVWESIPLTERSVDLLIERIRLIESRLPSKDVTSGGQALQINKKLVKPHSSLKVDKDKSLNSGSKVKCFICKGPHFASKCPKNFRNPKNNETEGHSYNEDQNKSSSFLCFVADGHSIEAFIADSGAS